MTDASALPAHYRDTEDSDTETAADDLRPTPGIEASEHGDTAMRSDMERINEHWRRRGRRPK